MISKIAGTNSTSSTRTKLWWARLGAAIVLSNVLFFLLFSQNEQPAPAPQIPPGWVEIHVRAELLTPFQTGKKVLLLQRNARKRVEAMLESSPVEPEGRFTVLVRESEAEALLKYDTWEIVPFLKKLSFAPVQKGENHEIRY